LSYCQGYGNKGLMKFASLLHAAEALEHCLMYMEMYSFLSVRLALLE